MIYFIKGKLVSVNNDFLVLESNSVGYKIFCNSKNDLKIGDEITLHTYLHFAEGILDLYGFTSTQERDMFILLLSVSKIGPKAAISILYSLPIPDLCSAVVSEDTDRLAKVKGIGPKSAQRIVMELKDKIKTAFLNLCHPSDSENNGSTQDSNISTGIKFASKFLDSVDALESLGCNRTQAEKLVSTVYDSTLSTQEIIKLALKNKA